MNKPENFLYDPGKTWEDNLEHGPFGHARDGVKYQNVGEPQSDFFGTKVYLPFGIAAGPLPRARFIPAVLDKGFDVVTFKSVRTKAYPCHEAPNVLPLDIGELDPTQTDKPIQVGERYELPLTLANSFGIPSFDPEVWQVEIKKSLQMIGTGQVLMAAFQGTDRGEGHRAFVDDHINGVKLLAETGARVIEVNLSCPNEGSSSLLCFNPGSVREIVEAIRENIDGIRLVVKIAFFRDPELLRRFVRQVGPLVDGITAINTVAARVVDANGEQAFAGSAARIKPGVSGHAIKHLGLDMVSRLRQLRGELGLSYKIIGVGGVQTPEDYHEYRANGADVVMALTGAMWNPNLAAQIKVSMSA